MKKIHNEVTFVASYLSIYFLKLYGEKVMIIFSPEYQDLTTLVVQKEYRSLYKEKTDLYKATAIKFDWTEEVDILNIRK